MIKINDLRKIYDGKQVLNVEELEIPRGEIFGIVGGNGSGKTTMLKIISKLIKSDGGMIETSIELDEMVYLFQKPHLFNTSVYNNIAYPLKFRKIPKDKIEKSVNKMIELFNLSHLMHQNATKLSGGEMQKVNLARALVFEPKLILLDEPTANIDTKATQQIEEILKQLGLSIVLVTHNMNQAIRLCDKVAVMHEGKVVTVDTPEVALRHECLQYI